MGAWKYCLEIHGPKKAEMGTYSENLALCMYVIHVHAKHRIIKMGVGAYMEMGNSTAYGV